MSCNNPIAQIFEPSFNNGGGGGTTNHTLLTNRDAADQHPVSAITGLQALIDSINAELLNKANIIHSHGISDITNLQTNLDGKAALSHTHTIANITNLQTSLDGKANTIHAHGISDITNLQTTLDGKAATSHTHTIANITNLQTSLDGKANTVHAHGISDITNLQTSLDGKANTVHAHGISDITNLQTSLDAKALATDLTTHASSGKIHVPDLTSLDAGSKDRVPFFDQITNTWQTVDCVKIVNKRDLYIGSSDVNGFGSLIVTTQNTQPVAISNTAASGSLTVLSATALYSNAAIAAKFESPFTGIQSIVGANSGYIFQGKQGATDKFLVDYTGKIITEATIQIKGGTPGIGKFLQCADANGNAVWATAAGGLSYFSETRTTTSPNTTIPAHQIIPLGAETNIDLVLTPKGTGALIAQIPINATTGGVKRGGNAVDFQMSRSNSAQVASGQYAVLGGGIDNTASGTRSCVTGGKANTASGGYTAIGGGDTNTASSTYDTVGGGFNNNASGTHSVISGGTYNQATGLKSSITGGTESKTTLYGERAFTSGKISDVGDVQFSEFILKRETTGTGLAELTLDNSSARLVMPDYSAWQVEVRIVGNKSTGGVNATSAVRQFLAVRGNGANTIQLSTIDTIGSDKSIGTFEAYTISITADTTNGAIAISVTPGTATKTRWAAYVSVVKQGSGVTFV